MQRAAKQTRKVNRWNAYLHSQVEAFNQDLAPGHPRPKVHEIARGIRERWDVMTEGERVAATQDAVVELEEQRESRQTAKRESRVSTTRDIRSTLDAIEAELQDLYARTGAEILLISVRSDVENFTAKPRIFTSSPRVADFFRASTNRSVNEFSVKLQAYCVADVQAPIVSPTLNVQQQILEMKRKVKEVINEKLQECARPARMPRINYVDFETCITERHGIICDNWPLPNFCAPGSINSLTELEVLYRAWSTGVTTFRKLSLEEWHQFKEVRTQHRLEAAIRQTSIAASNALQAPEISQMQPEAGPSTLSAAEPLTMSTVVERELLTTSALTLPQAAVEETPSVGLECSAEIPSEIPYESACPSDPSTSSCPAYQGLQYPLDADTLHQPPTSTSQAIPSPLVASTTTSQSSVIPSPTTPSSSEPSHQECAVFVFSTGKRPPPSNLNVLGPVGLIQKKPRKKRVDAGIKRGPNRRTTDKQQDEGESPSAVGADEAQIASSPSHPATELPQGEVAEGG